MTKIGTERGVCFFRFPRGVKCFTLNNPSIYPHFYLIVMLLIILKAYHQMIPDYFRFDFIMVYVNGNAIMAMPTELAQHRIGSLKLDIQ